MPQSGIGDTSVLRWDRRLRKYAADVKLVLPGKMRCFAVMESDDLRHWSRPRMTLYPDGLDERDSQIYGHRGFVYESMWIGFMRVMHTKRKGWKQTPVELTCSRDGRHWTRVGRREEFLPVSGGDDDWDADYHNPTSAPILVGNELWIFYESSLRPDHDRQKGDRHGLGLAILRRDGFVSLNAGDAVGTVRTRPLRFEGSRLHINAEVADGGHVRVGFISREGNKPIKGLSAGDCRPITAGGTDLPVSWPVGDDISHLADRHVRLEFQLRNAKLYSFWIE